MQIIFFSKKIKINYVFSYEKHQIKLKAAKKGGELVFIRGEVFPAAHGALGLR